MNKRYAIICTPRTGSSYLSDMLAGTRVAGFPEEHFNNNVKPKIINQLKI